MTEKESLENKEIEEKKKEAREKQFSSIRKMNTSNIRNALSINPSVLSKFDFRQVSTYLQNPSQYEKQLRNLSNYIYNVSAQYRQIIRHYATLLTFDYSLNILEIPDKINSNTLEKDYLKAAKYIDKLNLKHEMSKILKVAYKEDVFYGYEYENKDSYFINKLNPDFCRISHLEEGVFNFEFDFSYFDSVPDLVLSYPEEFQVKYRLYNLDKIRNRWLEIDSRKSISIKINEEITDYALPPFSPIFESIFDHDEYLKLRKSKIKMDNFLLLSHLIPINENSNEMDDFRIDIDTAMIFHEQLSGGVPDGVGVVTSPMEVNAIRMEKSKNDTDTVAESIRGIYTGASLSQNLFNSDKNTTAGINKSTIANEQSAFNLLAQIERWLNKKLKTIPGKNKFYVKFLEKTQFNKDEVFDKYLKANQNGSPYKFEMMAALGYSPLEVINKSFIENEIFKLHEKFIPLQTSHTLGSESGENNGRPSKSIDDLSDSRIADLDNSDE